ncbi:metal dependent amidohydrolase [Xylaria bambusicola]|uniref:metal dependent amidohydrolase n=1 Tax=Xylaria bambusicola TaxID=326684 RepID=UPI0020086190|nr:metal dependent amidohydrolase [Xylaria bambusicola]KAI0505954.1 metal dependent amidohydrolase [Xylaria bambusicola]
MNRIYHALLLAGAFLRPASAECRILKRGLSRDILLIGGTLLTPDGVVQRDSALFIQAGKIAYVGDTCGFGTGRGGDDASVVHCAGSVVSPGFINTHEHIDFSTVGPFPDLGERVGHRHDWRLGTRNFTMREVAVNGSEVDAVAWGELRHVFSGTTSIIGGEMVPGLARNLDFPEGLEDGLDARLVIYDTFPLKDRLGILRNGDCDYGADAIDSATATQYHRYIGHVGEGVDVEAANEFICLSNGSFDTTPAVDGGGLSTDIIAPNVVLVHALGLSRGDFDVVAARGAKVVWSPRSNMYLYGTTLDVTYLLDAGITVALGTDWLPSGSATIGREAACAVSATRELYHASLAPEVLWEMATVNAARVAGYEDELGSLEVGKVADIVVFGGGEGDGDGDPYEQAIFAPQEKIELVLRGGKVLVARSEMRDLAAGSCEQVSFGHVDKIVCVKDELGSSFRELEASLRGVYPAVLPGIPPYEPSCEPGMKL